MIVPIIIHVGETRVMDKHSVETEVDFLTSFEICFTSTSHKMQVQNSAKLQDIKRVVVCYKRFQDVLG